MYTQNADGTWVDEHGDEGLTCEVENVTIPRFVLDLAHNEFAFRNGYEALACRLSNAGNFTLAEVSTLLASRCERVSKPGLIAPNWLPIETAPKTGETFLAWHPSYEGGYVDLCCWFNDRWIEQDCPIGVATHPSHWMPAPPAPDKV